MPIATELSAPEKAKIFKAVHDSLKNGWNKNAYALNERGDKVDYSSSEAVSWCLAGALLRFCDARYNCSVEHAFATWLRPFTDSPAPPEQFTLVGYNDSQSKVDPILDSLKKAEEYYQNLIE